MDEKEQQERAAWEFARMMNPNLPPFEERNAKPQARPKKDGEK